MLRPVDSLSLSTITIDDHAVRAAAEVVDERFGTRGDRVVTTGDVKAAEGALQRHLDAVKHGRVDTGPLADITRLETDLLERKLPALEVRLARSTVVPIDPFATSIPVRAINDAGVRSCAAAIAELLGEPANPHDHDVNLRELFLAKAALRGLADGSLDKKRPALAAALRRRPQFNAANVAQIELFMMTGKGGLLSCGPVSVGGTIFPDCYRLCDHSDATTAEGRARVINQFEALMGDAQYDRVYVRTEQGGMYVALNPKGSLGDVQPGYRAQLGAGLKSYTDAGTVVRVVDIANSWHEATIGFWGKLVGKVGELIRSKLKRKIDLQAEKAADGVVNAGSNADPDKVAPAPVDWKVVVSAGVGTASFGAAFVNLPVTLGLLSATGIAITASNIYDFLRRSRDKGPVYNAIGVALNHNRGRIY